MQTSDWEADWWTVGGGTGGVLVRVGCMVVALWCGVVWCCVAFCVAVCVVFCVVVRVVGSTVGQLAERSKAPL